MNSFHGTRGSSRQYFEDLRVLSSDSRQNQTFAPDGDIFDSSPSKEGVEHPSAEKTSTVEQSRFQFFSSVLESTISATQLDSLVLPGENIRNLFELPEDETNGSWWLHIDSATEDEIRGICKAFGIHPLTVEDILTQEVREKIELFPSYYFASFRSFNIVKDQNGSIYDPYNIYIAVFREGVLSFSFAPNAHTSEVRERMAKLKEHTSLSSDWICYALM
jgi:magnesium transporter